MELVVDSREPKRYYEFVKKAFPKINVSREASLTGDYISQYSMAERKTLMDLHGSVMNHRIFDQEEKMSGYRDGVKILYIQGSMSEYQRQCEENGITPMVEHLYGVIASAEVRYGISVVWCENEWSGLVTLVKMMSKIHEGKYLLPAKKDDDILLARFVGCTTMQWKTIKQLAGPTLQDIINADISTFQKVYGIGPKKAESIKNKLTGVL